MQSMALSSFQLFLSQVKSAPESLRLKVLRIIFDILMTYEHDILNGAEGIVRVAFACGEMFVTDYTHANRESASLPSSCKS